MGELAARPGTTVLNQLQSGKVAYRSLPVTSRQNVQVSTFKCDSTGHGRSTPNPYLDVYMATMLARPMNLHWEWRDDKAHQVSHCPADGFRFFDFREEHSIDLQDPFDTVNIFIPRRAIRDVTDELHLPEISEMSWRPGDHFEDATMRHLAYALLPSVDAPEELDQLFTEHIFSAMTLHMVRTYSAVPSRATMPKGGLAPWLEKRAKDYLMSRMGDKVGLYEVAEICGLSPNHFGRAFRLSTGLSPYLWLRNQRIKQAQNLLHDTSLSLVDIALATGFATQSHFANAFKAATGLSPGGWRKLRSS